MRQNPYTSPPVLTIDTPHETKGSKKEACNTEQGNHILSESNGSGQHYQNQIQNHSD